MSSLNYKDTIASSASPDLVHWHEVQPTHLMASNIMMQKVSAAANDALFAIQELIVEAELTIDQVSEYFGIQNFSIHLMSKSLAHCKIILTADSQLEIHRPDAQVTRFHVERTQRLVA